MLRNWRKAALSLSVMIFVMAGNIAVVLAQGNIPAYIGSFLDKSSYNLEPEMLADVEPEAPVYRNPYMSYEPYTYVKGGVMYDDFAGLPDYGQYAQLGGAYIAVYPTERDSFFFVGLPDVTYTYRSKIIDYISSDMDTLKKYKAFIKTLGFTNKKKFQSEAYQDYIDMIQWQMKYDYNFKPDADGIFMVEGMETFHWLIIGKSVTYDSIGMLSECIEFRFYSLTRTQNNSHNILSDAGKLNNVNNPAGQGASLFTPNAVNDIGNVQNPPSSAPGYTTPNAVNDIGNVQNPPSSAPGYTTPNAVDDIGNAQNPPSSAPGYTTPNAVNDIGNAQNPPSSASGYTTPNAVNDIQN